VLQKEIEKMGIPAVLVTALTPTARMMGTSRVVEGVRVTSPVGDPNVSATVEKSIRWGIVEKCLASLTDPIDGNGGTIRNSTDGS
jgi:betaine reductase